MKHVYDNNVLERTEQTRISSTKSGHIRQGKWRIKRSGGHARGGKGRNRRKFKICQEASR